ncbi:MAG: DEAD/DEAH box helicase [Saprospiraceae bacterium]|jgi:ATP-dependent RNA helicase RhlE|nr:DEAD/DEAH box helicase [Saprospiraceae bacterium]
MTFDQLGLSQPLLRAVKAEGYDTPTPIQVQAIPLVLEGKDLMGCAQTGTGKTAAFGLPILQLLDGRPAASPRRIRCLVLTPTRELALQIGESFTNYGKYTNLRNTVIFGGVGQKPQTDTLARGVDILVATPGRLLDLMQQGFISLANIEIFVLDEADRMLDMGFVHDVRRVLAKLPTKRQSLFFSATMAPEIVKLASGILTDPSHVAVTPIATTAETVRQSVYFVEKKDKKHLLIDLLQDPAIESALVFTRTKHGANKLTQDLVKAGIQAEAIHGNKSQQARVRALQGFKNRTIRVLVATDIAARGIDIDELSHVVNYELPNIPESYVHRIGRTGRAGFSGTAISFCESEERPFLKDIQQLIRREVPVVTGHDYESANSAPIPVLPPKGQRPAPPATRPQNSPAPKPHAPRPAHAANAAADPTAPASGSKKRRRKRYGNWGKKNGSPGASSHMRVA